MAVATTKTCTGAKGVSGPHEASLDQFCAIKANKDGLSRICKPCLKVYNANRRAAKKASTEDGLNPSASIVDEEIERAESPSATAVATATVLPSDKDEVATPEGQAALEAAAQAAAASRRAADAERKRNERAAKKAAANS